MNRTALEERILEILDSQILNATWFGNAQKDLADLFIELSNERCIDQRMICHDEILKIDESLCEIMDPVLNAPLPSPLTLICKQQQHENRI